MDLLDRSTPAPASLPSGSLNPKVASGMSSAASPPRSPQPSLSASGTAMTPKDAVRPTSHPCSRLSPPCPSARSKARVNREQQTDAINPTQSSTLPANRSLYHIRPLCVLDPLMRACCFHSISVAAWLTLPTWHLLRSSSLLFSNLSLTAW